MRTKRLRRVLPRLFRQPRVLIIGCGDVGLRIIGQHRRHTRIIGSARSPAAAGLIRDAGARPLQADLDTRAGLARITGLANHIIYLMPPDNEHETEHRLSRVLAHLSQRSTATPTRIAYCGTTGVYGDAQGRLLTESTPVNPQSLRGRRRADAEKQLRRATSSKRTAPLKVSRLRAPGIYAHDRLPLKRLSNDLPVLERQHDSYSSHIHADDLGQALWIAMLRGANGRAYNACDGQQILMGDYFDQVADHLGIARPRRLPPDQVQSEVSPMMWSFMRESRRLSNRRLVNELKVQLNYPTIAKTLATVSSVDTGHISNRG